MATLKVTIAGKEFPLTVDESTHNEVLQAAESINQKILQHQQQFKVDVKDALAMCALEFATLNCQLQKTAHEWHQVQTEIDALHFTLQSAESI
ncbi:MAG: cell division protein ZapA [Bacteroidetes bacterium]|nr:cell division protein ZapA [Bacteroidota bacterium]